MPATIGLTCSSSKPKVLIPWQSSSRSSSDLASLVFRELLADEVTDMMMVTALTAIFLSLHPRINYSPVPPLPWVRLTGKCPPSAAITPRHSFPPSPPALPGNDMIMSEREMSAERNIQQLCPQIVLVMTASSQPAVHSGICTFLVLNKGLERKKLR